MFNISRGRRRLHNKQFMRSLLVLFDFNRVENCLSWWRRCTHLHRGCGIVLQLRFRDCEGGIERWSNSFGAFFSLLLLLLAPRALASNLVINSVLRRNGIFFIVLVDAFELWGSPLLLNLSVLLASVGISSVHIEDQVFLGSSWVIWLSFLVLVAGGGGVRCNYGRSSSIFCGLILKHLADSDGAAFIAESEAAELRGDVVLLQSDGDASLDAADDLGEATCKLGLLFLHTFHSLFTLLIGYEDLLNCAFVSNCVDVKDALVALWKNWLVWYEFE